MKRAVEKSRKLAEKGSMLQNARDGDGQALFHHEKLVLSSVALAVVERLSFSASVQSLSESMFRRLDVLATSMVLNIAEGNGRFLVLDQRRFLGTSHEAAVKLAARLDLCVAQCLVPIEEAGEMKLLLSRVSVMTSIMISESVS